MIYKGTLLGDSVALLNEGIHTDLAFTINVDTIKDGYITYQVSNSIGTAKNRVFLPNGAYPAQNETKAQAIEREERLNLAYLDKLVSYHTDTTALEFNTFTEAVTTLAKIQNNANVTYNAIIQDNNGYIGLKSTKYPCFEKYELGTEPKLKIVAKKPVISETKPEDDYPY